ncbi:MAG: MFS transporter [Caulobacteraceae bacterium]|nr:MFS transporter [Caulobacteraceae bacterium]
MAFFRNDRVNWLNLHYAISALVRTGGDAFFCAFLLQRGLPIPTVLTALAAILAGRFLVRPAVLPLAIRFGLRPMLIAGSVLVGAQYPLLALVTDVGPWLYALVAVSAVADAVYWTCYHAYFASLGDEAHRGHQIGAREAISALTGIVGPLATGWCLNVFGPMVAFGVTGAVQAVSALPLLRTPDAAVAPEAPPGSRRTLLTGAWFFAVDGWIGAGSYILWQIALFVSLGRSYTAFGGVLALAALVGAISGMALGRWIDRGHGRRAVGLALGWTATVLAFRAFAFGQPVLAVIGSAAGAVGAALYIPTLMTAVYNQAKLSPCPFRFHMAAEGGYDVGCAAGCLTAAAILRLGAPMSVALLAPLAGLVVMTVMLSRYYRRAGLLEPART